MHKKIKEYLINAIQDYVKDKNTYPYKYIIDDNDVDQKNIESKEKKYFIGCSG